MHNLLNTKHARYDFENAKPAALAWDVTDDSLLLAFGPSEHNVVITIKRLPSDARVPHDTTFIAAWDAPSPNPEFAVDRILDLHYFPDTRTISLILAGGDIVTVREDPQPGEDQIEIVGSVDAGISAAAWSPDEELVAVVTGAETLLLMTRAFESAANISISPEDINISNHVSVGWGKKETQFKGRGVAKTLRDPTVPEYVDEGTLSASDNGSVSISWRGDGQCVAVNIILDSEPRRRIIRVYSRDGTLESVSEPVNGLEGAISWKPSGQLIAGLQRLQEGVNVIFFERNGLRHGEFNLRLDNESGASHGSRISLQWNVDSTVLAVSMEDRVQLWTMNNYHYYLKQEIKLGAEGGSPANTIWHPEKPLYVASAAATHLRSLSYKFQVCRGSVVPPHDLGTVAVIDGKKLKVTPLRIANLPPPMAFDEIDLPEIALDVAINDAGNELAVLHHDSISLWRCGYSTKPAKKAVLKGSLEIRGDLSESNGITGMHAERGWLKMSEAQHVYTRTDHDRIFYFESEEHELDGPERFEKSTTRNPDFIKAHWRGHDHSTITFKLFDSGILYVHSAHQALQIMNCTSFITTMSHLIYTTSQHVLKFVHLHGGQVEIPGDEPEKDERCRSIERGAKIITVIPGAYSLVLQMPRGNLETIYPRALVLSGIRESIRNRDYKKAFLTCRTHRVDMNILHDFMPEQFMRDIELFVKQVKKTEYIDLFLSSLSEENVSETIYRNTIAPTEELSDREVLKTGADQAHPSTSSKINKVCDAFLKVLRSQYGSRLQNIVTAHVCKNPPDLEAGLRLVSELRLEGDEGRLEEAVEHICFLADVNQLYDTALGLYDLEVALLVAQQTQKDPREYIPYLEALHDMPTLRRQFTIDDDLKRHEKALIHLHALDAFDEITNYITKHELYTAAIDLYRYDNARLHELMRLYADFLISRNKFSEAGIAFEYISDHVSAYEAYRAANMWQACLSSALLVPLSAEELSRLSRDLADSLEEAKDYQGAATIHLDYLNDLENSARLLCKGYHYTEAMRQVTLPRRPELLKSIIDSALVDGSATMTELLSEMRSQLNAQVPRLRELRQKKVDDPMAFLDGAEGGDADIPDNLSIAPTDTSTTGGTFMTRYTNRTDGTLATNATRKTSKNRRREERKRARGKKGTVYEAEYLENSIARLIERLNDVGDDVTELIQCLMRRAMRERATAVQTAMGDVVGIARGCMDEVFTISTDGSVGEKQNDDGNNGESRPWGGQAVLWEAMRGQTKEAPVLKPFQNLSILNT